MGSEIIQNVAYDNYDNFQHVNLIFSQNFISLLWGLFNDEIELRLRYPLDMCSSVREWVCVCVFFSESFFILDIAKLLYCFGSIYFIIIYFFGVFFFFLSSFYFLLFLLLPFVSIVSIRDFTLVGYIFLLSIFFSFLFLPFSAALSVYVTRLLVKGTFSILVKGYKECLSVHWARESRTRTNKWGSWWQEFELSFNPFVCLSRRLL
jgi:hypothetical protein